MSGKLIAAVAIGTLVLSSIGIGILTSILLDARKTAEEQSFWVKSAFGHAVITIILLAYFGIWAFTSAIVAFINRGGLAKGIGLFHLAFLGVIIWGSVHVVDVLKNIKVYKDIQPQLIFKARISTIIAVFTILLFIALTLTRKWGKFFEMWMLGI